MRSEYHRASFPFKMENPFQFGWKLIGICRGGVVICDLDLDP
jgi:hypothetical protein